MKHTITLATLIALSISLAHAEEVCGRQKVYGRVLKVEPITEVSVFPTTSQDCSSGSCVSYVSQVTKTETTTGYKVTYRLNGKTRTIQTDEAPEGITIELVKESCVDKPKHKAVQAGTV
ncbi:hypothetical protein [Ralstonia insidiosa]|jgi:uncharacterized protein YcfJ|nr:hypothetical protein [Ralstonia insidiosa]MBA9939261.1 hypothetical protein [Ralstonia insidiosa]MBC9968033.1 hypothetical protein [Ralstonia insidiosa]MBX3904404.1 hypothetical protein [Ralstonia insidiosa]